MRNVTSGLQTALSSDVVRPAVFVEAQFDSGTIRFWTGRGEITWNGQTWTGSGDLLRVTRVNETQTLSANNVSYELSGIPSSLISIALAENYQGRVIKSWFAALNQDFVPIANPYEIFSGFMDVMNIEDSGEEAKIIVSCESELVALKDSGERRYTPEDQKQDYPNDLGLDFVPIIQDIELTFGAGRTD